MLQTDAHTELRLQTYKNFPFDVIRITGNDSVDFLQRMTTNEFANFASGQVQKTLVINEKGRMIDAVWVIHRGNDLLMLCSYSMSNDVMSWLNKFIIMEDIVLENVTSQFHVDLFFVDDSSSNNDFATDFFGTPVQLIISESNGRSVQLPNDTFELWRIQQGIPFARKELVQEYNPLELNLWDWISFTKGCYIGQEVIARLDTYNKIQRTLCFITFSDPVAEHELLISSDGLDIGKITSIVQNMGLAVIRSKFAQLHSSLFTANKSIVKIEKIFRKEGYGRT